MPVVALWYHLQTTNIYQLFGIFFQHLPPEVLKWWLHPVQWFSSEQLWELLPGHSGQWIQVWISCKPACVSDWWWMTHVQVWYGSSGRQHGSGKIFVFSCVQLKHQQHFFLFYSGTMEHFWWTEWVGRGTRSTYRWSGCSGTSGHS